MPLSTSSSQSLSWPSQVSAIIVTTAWQALSFPFTQVIRDLQRPRVSPHRISALFGSHTQPSSTRPSQLSSSWLPQVSAAATAAAGHLYSHPFVGDPSRFR